MLEICIHKLIDHRSCFESHRTKHRLTLSQPSFILSCSDQLIFMKVI
jgi:hypothetical protein